MSIRQILVTDPTDADFGKIAPEYIPGTHPPATQSVQSYTFTSDIREDDATDRIEQVIYTLGGASVEGPITGPTRIGLLYGTENLQLFTNASPAKLKYSCQILVNNLIVDWGADNYEETLTLQVYLNVYIGVPGDFDGNSQETYPMPAVNPGPDDSRIKQITPTITLHRSGPYLVGETLIGQYYSGVGTIEDFSVYGPIYKIDLYGCFLTAGSTLPLSLIAKTDGSNPTVAEAGTIHYMLSISPSN